MNMSRNHRSIWTSVGRWTLVIAVMVALVIPVIVLADTAPPAATLKKNPPAWMGMGIMFILVGLVLGVSLLPSKRGHQD